MMSEGGVAAATATGGAVGGKQRDQWSSRLAFYMAGIGAAVGFGNVWRFPALSVKYGGGAFFIPYLMALFLIGIPITILEIGFGQYFQTGDIGVFGTFHPRLRGVGVSSIACGFMVVTYYSCLIAWVLNAFFDSFGNDPSGVVPWNNAEVTGGDAVTYFIDTVIGSGTVNADDLTPTRMVGRNVGYSALVWFIVYICVAFGVKWTGRITYVTMGLPIILLFVFLIRGLTLEGAQDGIVEYIGRWDMQVLKDNPAAWSEAVSQIFFSVGVTFGILTAYGSHCASNEPVALNSFVIACSNCMFSFIAGFAVFGALGHLAVLEEKEVTQLDYAGFSLVFGTWPVVLNTLPGGIHWVRLLFFNLFLLGIDSAFALFEAVLTCLQDTSYFQNGDRKILAVFPILIGFGFSLIYCTDAGLFFLDTIDFYINFVMILVGFAETFAAGWAYHISDQMELLSQRVVFTYMATNFGSVFLACGLWFGLPQREHAWWAGFVGGLGLYAIGMAWTHTLLVKHRETNAEKWPTISSIWYELSFGNIVQLRDRIQPSIGKLPFVWCFLIKQFIPHALIVLFINLARAKTFTGESTFGHYGGYVNKPYQVLGMLTFFFALFLFIIGLIVPQIYEPLALPQNKEAQAEASHYLTTTNTDNGATATTKDVDGGSKKGEKASSEEEEEIAPKLDA